MSLASITHGHILLFTVTEAILSFTYLPQLSPDSTLSGIFFLFASVNWGLWAIWKTLIYPFFYSPFRNLPKPKTWGLPFIGHGLGIFRQPIGEMHLEIARDNPSADIVLFRTFGNADRLIPMSAPALAEILVHKSYDFEKPPPVRLFLRRLLGNGLLTSEGEEHKHQRKHLMPSFSFRHIKELYPIFWRKALEMCQTIKTDLAERQSDVVDITHFATLVTMDIIGLAGMGRDMQTLKGGADELVATFEEIVEPTAEKAIFFLSNILLPQWLIARLPWKINERFRVTTSKLQQICRDLVREKKEQMKTQSESHIDILSILLRSDSFSDNGLVDQLVTFLAAGHETTSSALTWTSHLLAIHPDIQTRLRSEIHEHISSPSDLQTSQDISALLESLPYLNAVCNESLRIFPTIPLTSRYAVRNTTILGHHIPAKTEFFIAPWAVNRLPQLWGPDGAEFKPERWIDPKTGKANYIGSAGSNFNFLTFLHGPRSCIGEKFARAELRALVAAFVGSFEWEMADPNAKVRPGGTITVKPRDGMRLRLRSVKWEK